MLWRRFGGRDLRISDRRFQEVLCCAAYMIAEGMMAVAYGLPSKQKE